MNDTLAWFKSSAEDVHRRVEQLRALTTPTPYPGRTAPAKGI
jgi:hypothetical protein